MRDVLGRGRACDERHVVSGEAFDCVIYERHCEEVRQHERWHMTTRYPFTLREELELRDDQVWRVDLTSFESPSRPER